MPETKSFDVVVIGSGPGGYVAAIRAQQEGLSTALIEKTLLGGTCLNVGCIPTKTLLSNAAVLHQIKRAEQFGIAVGPVTIHYEKMKARKDQVLAKMRSGLEGLLKSNGVTVFRGAAQFESPREIKVLGQDNVLLHANSVIIATGSVPFDVGAFPCDHVRILNSTSVLELTQLPKSIAIVGGGYIGCEFASLFVELGTKVTILESQPAILSPQGATVAKFMTKAMQARGVELRTGAKVLSIKNSGHSAAIELDDGSKFDAEFALIAVGRKAYTEGLQLERAGLKTTDKGFLTVNDEMQTEVPGIYAIGDVTGHAMLAHVASHQGIVAAMRIAGKAATSHYDAVPAVIFTSPEVATVGLTLEQAQAKNPRATAATFPFQALGKAQASIETEGFAEIVSDPTTGQIFGATVIGHEASNLIGELTLAIQNELTLESVVETIHAHPTIGESWHEAAAIGMGWPINFPPKRKT